MEAGRAPLYPHDERVLAVAADHARPDGLRDSLAWLDLNQPQQVLAWLLTHLKKNSA